MFLTSDELKEVLPDPVETVRKLDRYIVGQTAAKKTLALMLLNRAILKLHKYKKINMKTVPHKTNTLMIGPTGTGKTALLKALEKVSGVPVTLTEVTAITSAGYIGGKVEDILVKHVNNCAVYVAKNLEQLRIDAGENLYPSYTNLLQDAVENGIIYLDEIDKICQKGGSGVDVTGDSVQNELLKILESGEVNLESSRMKTIERTIVSVNTENIYYVAGGAFSGLKEIINRRQTEGNTIGFSRQEVILPENVLSNVTTEDLIRYGFKPEFLGRISLRTYLNDLKEEDMIHILTGVENNLFDQYYDQFRLFNVHLVMTKESLKAISRHALSLKTGARALKSILDTVLAPELYGIFKNKRKRITITEEIVNERVSKL